MLKDDFCMIGIGQGGCKMAKEFYDNKYRSFFINTSYDDLSQLKVDDSYTYHIPSAKGCAKQRDVAINYAKNYYEEMTGKLMDTHPTSKIFVVHYTLGGGTGGGLSNVFIATLRNKLKEMGKKDWIIIAVVAKPRGFESYQLQSNASKSLEDLLKLEKAGIVTQYYVINNDSRDNFDDINQEHYILLDRWIEGEGANNNSNVEESERLDLFKNKGQAMMFTFDAVDINVFKDECKKAYDESIYCQPIKRPNSVGYAINEKIKEKDAVGLIEEVVGLFPNSHMTPTKVSNVIMVAGCEENKAIMNDIKNLANKKASLINSETDSSEVIEDVELESLNRSKESDKKKEDKETMASIDDILNFFS